jgi:hypothetical protein
MSADPSVICGPARLADFPLKVFQFFLQGAGIRQLRGNPQLVNRQLAEWFKAPVLKFSTYRFGLSFLIPLHSD